MEIKIKVTDIHFSDIKRTLQFYSNTLHGYVCTYDRTEEEHVNIYWVTFKKCKVMEFDAGSTRLHCLGK